VADKDLVPVKYLGDDAAESGTFGYTAFVIKAGYAHVPPDVAQAMVLDQPSLWAVSDRTAKQSGISNVPTAVAPTTEPLDKPVGEG
jgi:hypothetical protein